MKRNTKRNRGQGLVEFALMAPLFLILLFGMAEFGRAWMTKNIITGAAREAVRIFAVIPYDCNVATTRAVDILSSANLDPARWNISLAATDNNGVVVPLDDAIMMRADVTYNFPVLVGFIPGLPSSGILLASSTTMRKE